VDERSCRLWKLGRRDACVERAVLVRGGGGGYVLRLHLDRPVRIRGARVQEHAGLAGVERRCLCPEVRREEGDRAFEVGRVQKERPALVAGRHLLSERLHLWVSEGQRQVAVAEELAAGALLEVQPIRRPDHPRAELRDAIESGRVAPVTPLARTRPVGPLAEIERNPTHDELRGFGREAGVAPPSEPALDVAVMVLRLRIGELREHPCAEEPALELLPRIVLEERPRRDVHREACVVAFVDPIVGNDEVSGKLS